MTTIQTIREDLKQASKHLNLSTSTRHSVEHLFATGQYLNNALKLLDQLEAEQKAGGMWFEDKDGHPVLVMNLNANDLAKDQA